MSPLLEGRDQSWCTRILAQQGRSMEGCMPNICGTKLGQGAPSQWRLWPHCLAPCCLWGWKRKILKEKLRQFLSLTSPTWHQSIPMASGTWGPEVGRVEPRAGQHRGELVPVLWHRITANRKMDSDGVWETN